MSNARMPAHDSGIGRWASSSAESCTPGVTTPGVTSIRWYQAGTAAISRSTSAAVVPAADPRVMRRAGRAGATRCGVVRRRLE
jgi:hypothetical protein